MVRTATPIGPTAYLNARLLDPASGLDSMGEMVVENGRITNIGPSLFADAAPENMTTVDCEGAAIAPGLTDMRVFVGEPGFEYRETLQTASQAAAAGGITRIIAQPNTDPILDDVAVVEYLMRRARETASVRVDAMAAITRGLKGQEMTEFALLLEAGAVAFTEGDRSVADTRVMRRALSYATTFDTLIVQHVEDPALAADGVMNEGEIATRLGLMGTPSVAETIILERDLRLLELSGGRYHVAQISCRQSADAVRNAKNKGLNVTCGVSPHHIALNELEVTDYRTFAKTSPPLRTEEDRLAMEEALADGTIDVIASSHDPQDEESKRLPFAQAAYGVVGLETMFSVALRLYHNGVMSLLDVLGKMTIGPAQILQNDDGRLQRGAPADFFIFDPDAAWQVDRYKLLSHAKNSAFDGRGLEGRVLKTIVGGATVFDIAS